MEIVLNIPDEIALQMDSDAPGLARMALEAFALEGYRWERLSEGDVREMLGLETRMEVHAFLKQHGVHLQYSVADLERDRAAVLRTRTGRLLPIWNGSANRPFAGVRRKLCHGSEPNSIEPPTEEKLR